MTTTITSIRFLALVNDLVQLQKQTDEGMQQLARAQVESLAALETLADKQIKLHTAIAQRATNEMQKLQLQKDIRKRMPKLARLKGVLEQATSRLTAACGEGEEQALRAGRDYAIAVDEYNTLNAESEAISRSLKGLESKGMWLNIEVIELQNAVDQASEAYGEAVLCEEGCRLSIPMNNQLAMAKNALRQAAASLLDCK